MSFIVWQDDDERQNKEMVKEYLKKLCESGSLAIDEELKTHQAATRMDWGKSPPKHLLNLKYSRVEAWKNDQFAQASKLQQEVEDIKKQRNEIHKEVDDFYAKWHPDL